MAVYQQQIMLTTRGRGTYNITSEVEAYIRESRIKTGICHLFVQHTSASLLITENADPRVRGDLETILQRLAPDGDPEYDHNDEGDDDMSAHVRCMLTQTELSIPVTRGRGALGIWQGIYLYEHRAHALQRKITLTLYGE